VIGGGVGAAVRGRDLLADVEPARVAAQRELDRLVRPDQAHLVDRLVAPRLRQIFAGPSPGSSVGSAVERWASSSASRSLVPARTSASIDALA
jgi:hypothetical protein